MKKDYQNLNNVLFIRFGAIGDIVHTTLTYQSLKNYYKSINIDYLTTDIFKCLLENESALREIITISSHSYKSFTTLFALGRILSQKKYDLVVNLQPSFKTYFLTYLINPRYTLIYKKHKKDSSNSLFHAVISYFRTINPILSEYSAPTKLHLALNPKELEWAKSSLKLNNITNFIAIVPGVSASRVNKLWPKDYWKKLLDYLCNVKSYKVVILGGLQEINLVSELEGVSTNIVNYSGKLTLDQTAAILSLSDLVIGSDTGPTHIATAVSKKVIGLYGPTSINRVGLYGDNHISLLASNSCICCEQKKCKYFDQNNIYSDCMKSITVEKVIEIVGI